VRTADSEFVILHACALKVWLNGLSFYEGGSTVILSVHSVFVGKDLACAVSVNQPMVPWTSVRDTRQLELLADKETQTWPRRIKASRWCHFGAFPFLFESEGRILELEAGLKFVSQFCRWRQGMSLYSVL
jgi:hypothetical protein